MKIFNTIFSLFLFFYSPLFAITYSGTIYQSSIGGAKLEGVTVQTIESSTLDTLTDITGDSGKFSFNVSKGTYCIVQYKAGYQLFASTFNVTSATTLKGSLSHTFKDGISGTITDTDTEGAISGATVVLFYNSYPIFTTTTDENGYYETPQIMHEYGANYKLTASKSGYQTKSVSAENDLNGSTSNISLAIDHAILSGKITATASGNEIEGCLVTVQLGDQTVNYDNTDSEGNYTVEGLAPTSYNVIITADGYQNMLEGVEVDLSATTIYNATLDLNGGEVVGTITDLKSNLPAQGIEMILQLDGVTVQSVTTDDKGRYSFSNLGEHLYVIIAGGNNHETGYSKARIVDATPITADFILGNDPGSIIGKITDGTTSLAGSIVTLKQNDIPLRSFTTTADGKYSLIGLAAGNYLCYASEEGYQTRIQAVEVENDKPTSLDFALDIGFGSIEGTVTESGSGDPVSGAHIKVISNGLVYAEKISASDGKYTVKGLPTGNYSLNAGTGDYQYGLASADVVVGDPAVEVNFLLETGGVIVSGIITNAITGEPIDGAVVKVIDQNTDFFEYTVTQANGEYRLKGLFSSTYVVNVIKNGYIPKDTDPFAVTTLSLDEIPKDVEIYSQNPPTNNLQGKAFSNWSLLAEDRIHQITWSKTTSEEVTGYRVYRNGVLVKTVGLNHQLFYEHHNNPIDNSVLYTVTSINSNGTESAGKSIQL